MKGVDRALSNDWRLGDPQGAILFYLQKRNHKNSS